MFLLCRHNLTEISTILENIQNNTLGLGTIHVFFINTENKKTCRIIKKQFSNIIFIPYELIGSKNLKIEF
jgi:hypothetical protein